MVECSITPMANSCSEWPRVADPLRAKHESFPEELWTSLCNASHRCMLERNFEMEGDAGVKQLNKRELK